MTEAENLKKVSRTLRELTDLQKLPWPTGFDWDTELVRLSDALDFARQIIDVSDEDLKAKAKWKYGHGNNAKFYVVGVKALKEEQLKRLK